jgi:hypothetical protein
MLVILRIEENDHAGHRNPSPGQIQAPPLGTKASSSAPSRRYGRSTCGSIRTKLQIADRKRDLAMFNLAIDNKLRGCDIVALKVEDVAAHGYAVERSAVA